MQKAITVIIPCYNAADTINRCLDSLVRQTIGLSSLEIICVDDASTDDTRRILGEWEARFPDQLVLVPLDENGRQGRARNIALTYASCDWVAYLDADDWLDRNCLETLYSCTKEYAYDIIACKIGRTSSENPNPENGPVPNGACKRYHLAGDDQTAAFFRSYPLTYSACGRLISKSFLLGNGILFPEGVAYEDTFFGALCSILASHVCVLDDTMYHYYVNTGSTVLQKDASYHLDLLTVQEMLWSEYLSRNLPERFPELLQFEYLYSCCLAFWKVIALRFETPPYEWYRLLCAVSREKIKGFEDNPYVKDGGLREHHILMIQSLLNPLTKEQFYAFVESIRKIGL